MKNLGRYRILREIGRGAMGVVYQGFDTEIERVVAVKTIQQVGTDGEAVPPETLERFKQEIRIVGQLQHPNIVTLYDVGESEGVRYFAMEYVEGSNLATWMAGVERMSLQRALEILKAVAEGLAYAHDRGVVHCDIKPSNILISHEGAVKITDFGIARWSSLQHGGTQSITGTPAYIAPEQATGREITRVSDVFSTGVLTYELLTGVRPFQGASLAHLIQQVLHETPEPPSSLNPEIPPLLDAVVMTALEKEPGKRCPDMRAFRTALVEALEAPGTDRTLAGELTATGPAAAAAGGRVRRWRRVWLPGLALLVLLTAGVPLSRYLGVWGGAGAPPGGQAFALAFSEARAGRVEQAREAFQGLAGEEDTRDQGLVGLAYLSCRNGDYAETLRLCEQALQQNPGNLYAHVLRAQVSFARNQPGPAEAELMQALNHLQGAAWEKADAYTLLGRIQELDGRNEEALSSYEEAIRLDPAGAGTAYANKGALLARLGNYPAAVASYRGLLDRTDDPASLLLAKAEMKRLDAKLDAEKREYVRAMIRQLDEDLEKKKDDEPGAAKNGDPWSSRPLTVCIYPLAEKGDPSLDSSTGMFLQAKLSQALGADPRFSLVDREVLDGILQELHLAGSELADREKALRVGRIAGAHLIVTGNLFHLGGTTQAILQVVETETTYVKSTLSEEQGPGESLNRFGERVASSLGKGIREAYPLQGRIVDLQGGQARLDIGAETGAREGMRFRVLPGGQEDLGQPRKAYVAVLTLTGVGERQSHARIDERYDPLEPGQRVVEVQQEPPPGAPPEASVKEES